MSYLGGVIKGKTEHSIVACATDLVAKSRSLMKIVARNTLFGVKDLPILLMLLLLCGCGTSSAYQKNLTKTTDINSHYLKNQGYRIIDINKKTGYIEAVTKLTGTCIRDNSYNYKTTSNVRYQTENLSILTADRAYSLSSITAYLAETK